MAELVVIRCIVVDVWYCLVASCSLITTTVLSWRVRRDAGDAGHLTDS